MCIANIQSYGSKASTVYEKIASQGEISGASYENSALTRKVGLHTTQNARTVCYGRGI